MPPYRKADTRRQHRAALTGDVGEASRAPGTRRWPFFGVVLVVSVVAALGILVHESESLAAPSFSEILRGGTLTQADGVLPDGVTAFDDQYPGVAKFNPGLLAALRRATTAAATDDVHVYLNSGWRSRAYQDELLNEAVAQYGSRTEAAKWVATADTSPHVSGNAADIGPVQADTWLSEHGAAFGLCQIYRNEPWHYELRPAAVTHGCPRMYSDPTQDPRMQR